jgi:hypothetical protein
MIRLLTASLRESGVSVEAESLVGAFAASAFPVTYLRFKPRSKA